MAKKQYVALTVEERKALYLESMEVRKDALKNKIPFMFSHFLPNFYLCQGLILIGAKSGKGKSTTAAHVIAGYLNGSTEGTCIVISNEENTDAIFDRVACIILGFNYINYFNGSLSELDRGMVVDTSLELTKRIEVVNDAAHDTSVYENVKAVLAHAADKTPDHAPVGLVILDYFQTVNTSEETPGQESFVVLKRLGHHLKKYGRQHGVPVVTFAQLNDEGKGGKDMASRVQNDKTIFNHAFIAIEVISDFDTSTTKFRITKDRFWGCTGKEVEMKFEGGRYVLPEPKNALMRAPVKKPEKVSYLSVAPKATDTEARELNKIVAEFGVFEPSEY